MLGMWTQPRVECSPRWRTSDRLDIHTNQLGHSEHLSMIVTAVEGKKETLSCVSIDETSNGSKFIFGHRGQILSSQ